MQTTDEFLQELKNYLIEELSKTCTRCAYRVLEKIEQFEEEKKQGDK